MSHLPFRQNNFISKFSINFKREYQNILYCNLIFNIFLFFLSLCGAIILFICQIGFYFYFVKKGAGKALEG